MSTAEQPALPPHVVIVGPTASGKSALAMGIARQYAIEIVNCDSVQVYRGFDIGAAKPTAAERAAVPHHLLDIVEPQEDFDAAQFATRARAAIVDIAKRGLTPVVVGGTGLYLRALWGWGFDEDLPGDAALRAKLDQRSTSDLLEELQRLDPNRAGQLHPNDRVRILRAVEIVQLTGQPVPATEVKEPQNHPQATVLKMVADRAWLHQKIAERVEHMLARGLIAEVEGLLQAGVPTKAKPMQSIGYRQVAEYLAGRIAKAELPEKICAATRQYAKRQDTWFRRVSGTALSPGQMLPSHFNWPG